MIYHEYKCPTSGGRGKGHIAPLHARIHNIAAYLALARHRESSSRCVASFKLLVAPRHLRCREVVMLSESLHTARAHGDILSDRCARDDTAPAVPSFQMHVRTNEPAANTDARPPQKSGVPRDTPIALVVFISIDQSAADDRVGLICGQRRTVVFVGSRNGSAHLFRGNPEMRRRCVL